MLQRCAAVGFDPKQRGESCEILEPSVFLGKGLDDHRGAVCLEPVRFENGGSGAVEQLVTDVVDRPIRQSQ